MNHALIMAGGSGTRLWPESTPERPKQFLKLDDGRTLLAATCGRVAGLIPRENIIIATAERMLPLVNSSVPEIPDSQILLEPLPRNTTACIGLAAIKIMQNDPEGSMLVLPSDHLVRNRGAFQGSLRKGLDLLERHPERLFVFGIKPDFPAVSYGYIEKGAEFEKNISSVKRFREKPERSKAVEFLESGNYYWNAGIFLWKSRTILEQIDRFEPEIGSHLRAIAENPSPENIFEHFSAMKSISIDYAVLERAAGSIAMIEAEFDWDDIGTWGALERLHAAEKDVTGNIASGVKLISVDSGGCFVRGDSERTVALVGVRDLIVIQSGNTTLIVPKDREEAVRRLADEI